MDFDKATKIKKIKDALTNEVKVVQVDSVDGAGTKVSLFIPMKEVNTDYKRLLEWAAIDGNNIEEAD
jgi:glutamine synthetase|tara:strand:- start:30 stop:230 length:201 start_codon:yes stop_codon:yes gene_type:complete